MIIERIDGTCSDGAAGVHGVICRAAHSEVMILRRSEAEGLSGTTVYLRAGSSRSRRLGHREDMAPSGGRGGEREAEGPGGELFPQIS